MMESKNRILWSKIRKVRTSPDICGCVNIFIERLNFFKKMCLVNEKLEELL